jgi:hypothetical protein
MAAKNRQPLLPGFHSGFVYPVELEEFTVSLANFLFHVTIPEVSSQAKGAVGLLVEGNVIRAFELDHVIASGLVLVVM